MLDLFHFREHDVNVQIFNRITPGITTAKDWQTWYKPRGCSMHYLFALGGGGGGGDGEWGATGTTRAGGGGGGGSAYASLLIPTFLIPHVLFIEVGEGGPPTSSGGSSFISINQSSAAANLFLSSGNPGTAGTNGALGVAGAGGAGGTAATVSANCNLAGAGTFYAVAGQTGGNGTTASDATGVTWGATALSIIGGGAGGAGISNVDDQFLGGRIIGAAYVPTIPTSNTQDYQIYGSSAPRFTTPFAGIGGCGGSSYTLTAFYSPNGGNGCYGGGGGGGGAEQTGPTGNGGAGGYGGAGLVIIISW